MQPPDLESQLPALLRRTVADVPVDTQLEQRVRQIVQHGPPSPRPRPELTAAIAVALIVVLAISGFVWLRPLTGSSSAAHPRATVTSADAATSTATSAPTSTPVSPAAATDKGITIVIDRAYADASQTMVFCHLTSTAYQLSQLTVDHIAAQVNDSEGHVYDPMAGAGGVNSAEQNYTPLLPSLLIQPQALTLVVKHVELTPIVAVGGVNSIEITGLWQVPFVVTPITPEVRTFHVAPITHAGVSVQPVSLETFSGQHPFDTNNNEGAGGRLILRLGGLTTLGALQNAAQFDFANLRGMSIPGAGAHLTFAGLVPSDTGVLLGSVQGDSEEVEILYWVPLQFSGSTATLSIDRILLGFPATFATGPWTFDLPVS